MSVAFLVGAPQWQAWSESDRATWTKWFADHGLTIDRIQQFTVGPDGVEILAFGEDRITPTWRTITDPHPDLP